MSVYPYGVRRPNPYPITVVVSQNVTNQICMVCVKSENMHSWLPSDPFGP